MGGGIDAYFSLRFSSWRSPDSVHFVLLMTNFDNRFFHFNICMIREFHLIYCSTLTKD